MQESYGERIEQLSKKMGGRFRLTALVQKRMRGYYTSGRAFMPNVRNLDELFGMVLDQIERGEVRLRNLPEAPPRPFLETGVSSTLGFEANQ